MLSFYLKKKNSLFDLIRADGDRFYGPPNGGFIILSFFFDHNGLHLIEFQ